MTRAFFADDFEEESPRRAARVRSAKASVKKTALQELVGADTLEKLQKRARQESSEVAAVRVRWEKVRAELQAARERDIQQRIRSRGEARPCIAHTRLTPDEMRGAVAAATSSGKTLSQWMRDLVRGSISVKEAV